MRVLLRNVCYRRLLVAQCVALIATGVATVALGLLAYDLAGRQAAAVLGTALAIKMAAYVTVSPLVGALASRFPRRWMMVGADAVRVVVALLLPLVGEIWQVYVLIAVLQIASATFTPVYQSTLADVVPDESDYATALSASQFVVSAENIVSPALAAAALLVLQTSSLFALTAIGFAGSLVLVAVTRLPAAAGSQVAAPFRRRLTQGMRILFCTPRMRAVLALNAVVAATGVITLVTTVNVTRDLLGGSERDVALLLGASGAGTAAAALAVPRLLVRNGERRVMGVGAALAVVAVVAAVAMSRAPSWFAATAVWGALGVCTALITVPVGRLVRDAAAPADRPAAFAAQFALSHACWLVTYPLTGALVTTLGFTTTWAVLAGIVLAAGVLARGCWPADLRDVVRHAHDDTTDPDHLSDAALTDVPGRWVHTHRVVIDEQHRHWPRPSPATGS